MGRKKIYASATERKRAQRARDAASAGHRLDAPTRPTVDDRGDRVSALAAWSRKKLIVPGWTPAILALGYLVGTLRLTWPLLYRQFGVDPARAGDKLVVNYFREKTGCCRSAAIPRGAITTARCAKTYPAVHAAMALILAGRVGWFSRPQRVDCLGVLPVPTSGDCRLGVALAFLRTPSLRCVSGDDSYGWRNSTGAGCSDVAQPALPRPCGGNAAHAGSP